MKGTQCDREYPRAAALAGERAGAMFDRAERNACPPVKTEPALSPIEVVFAWAEESGVRCAPAALIDLAERLRRDATILFAEDGRLVASHITFALRTQVALMRDESWVAKNKLRILLQHAEEVCAELGLL